MKKIQISLVARFVALLVALLSLVFASHGQIIPPGGSTASRSVYTNRLLTTLSGSGVTNRQWFTNNANAFGNTNVIHIRTNATTGRWEWHTDWATCVATNTANRPTGTWQTAVASPALYGYTRYESLSPTVPSVPSPGSSAISPAIVQVDTNGTPTDPGSFFDAISPLLSARTVYVAKDGKTNYPGTLLYPKPAISNGLAVAVAGDTVNVGGGTYAENNLLKANVNIVGSPGANLLYVQTTTNDACWGLLDDRASGATTNIINWLGNMVFISLTNMAFYDTGLDDGSFPYNVATAGAIVVTNPATVLKVKGGLLSYTACGYDVLAATAINAVRGTLHLEFDVITNLLHGIALTAGELGSFPLFGDGIDTVDANVHLKANILFGDTYSWFWHSTNLLATNDVYITADKIVGPIYGDSVSDNTRGWVRAMELDTAGIGTGVGIGCYSSGKWYYDILKIKSGSVAIRTVGSVKTNTQVWVTSQKIEPGTGYVDAQAGNVFLTVFHPLGGSAANGMTTAGNGRIFPQFSVSGLTNVSASATSVTVKLEPAMMGTNYTPSVRFGFNSGTTNVWYSSLTRSNFTANFAAVAGGGAVFFEAKQNAQ